MERSNPGSVGAQVTTFTGVAIVSENCQGNTRGT
jgi:hypothetical protein